MSRLATFFDGADTHLGVFYPSHYLIAVLANLDRALAVEQKLRSAGFSGREVIAVPGEDLGELVREEAEQGGIHAYLMKEFSRFLHTEAAYTDLDLQAIRRGAAVLAVHCADDKSKAFAWSVVAPAHPLAARYYSTGAIEHLAGET